MPTLTGFSPFDQIPVERITDKITRRVVSGEKGMIVWWDIKAGAHAAAHSHPHEQIVWMVKGKMDFRIGGERRLMAAGDIAVIPGGCPMMFCEPVDFEHKCMRGTLRLIGSLKV